MNYSTITQSDEPFLNREVKLSLKTILGAAAFVSFVIGSLVVVVAPLSRARTRRSTITTAGTATERATRRRATPTPRATQTVRRSTARSVWTRATATGARPTARSTPRRRRRRARSFMLPL